MLTIPGVPNTAVSVLLVQAAGLACVAAGFALMLGLRTVAMRLGALAGFLFVVMAWLAQGR